MMEIIQKLQAEETALYRWEWEGGALRPSERHGVAENLSRGRKWNETDNDLIAGKESQKWHGAGRAECSGCLQSRR